MGKSTSTWRSSAFVAALTIAACTSESPEQAAAQETAGNATVPGATEPDGLRERVMLASPYVIAADPELDAFVVETAEAAIGEHCAGCHGADLTGRVGVPSLVDFEWLWGITFEETSDVAPVMALQQTILYGIRNTDCPEIEELSYYGGCADTRYSEMPAYLAGDIFDEQQVDDLTEYVIALAGGDADEALARAEPLAPLCAECHGADGTGYKPYGGPDLTDDVWLYGSDRDAIYDVIANGRLGHCPAWGRTLDAATVKALAVYIWRRASGG